MLIFENKKAKLINILRMGINPFKKFVSTGEIKEELGLVDSRTHIMNEIIKTIENNENIILPIIGNVGSGKTHLYWALKKGLIYFNSIYISLENVYRKFNYNIYSEYVEELGVEVLRGMTNSLCDEWGALERKFGFFHVADIEKVRNTAFETLSNKFDNKIALNDIIVAITAHQLDPYKKLEAEKWLLGELMDFRDLSHLNLLYDLSKSSYAYTTLKIMVENSKLGSVFFIDDFERIITLMKPEEGIEEIFDPSYLYGAEISSPDNIAAQKILDKILKLLKIKGLSIVITLNSTDSLKEIIKIIGEQNQQAIIKDPIYLSDFLESDIYSFYKKSIEEFLKNINLSNYIDEFTETYYPLNERILEKIYQKSGGNPREIIKNLSKIFNDIIFSEEDISEILMDYE
jgi:hypothetical protein